MMHLLGCCRHVFLINSGQLHNALFGSPEGKTQCFMFFLIAYIIHKHLKFIVRSYRVANLLCILERSGLLLLSLPHFKKPLFRTNSPETV